MASDVAGHRRYASDCRSAMERALDSAIRQKLGRDAASCVRVSASPGRVTLWGNVGNYYQKQLVWHEVRKLVGAANIVDNVGVV